MATKLTSQLFNFKLHGVQIGVYLHGFPVHLLGQHAARVEMMGDLVQVCADLSQGGEEFFDYGDFNDGFLLYRDSLSENGLAAIFRDGQFRPQGTPPNGGIVVRFKPNRYPAVKRGLVFLW